MRDKFYEYEKGVAVVQVGFVTLNEFVGVSPDGLVDDNGLIEIKARNDEKHMDLLLGGPIDSGTIWQMNMQMLVTGRSWCDFISYNPNFKNSLFVKRFIPDPKKVEGLKKGFEVGAKLIGKLIHNSIIQTELKF